MRTRLDRWGNSLGVRIPKALADEADLREGDHVEMHFENGVVVLRPARPHYTLDELLEGFTEENVDMKEYWIDTPALGRERFWEEE